MEKYKTYKIWTKHGHFTLFCMVLHHFTTANTFCAKGSPHLLVPYCKFCCTAKLSFVAFFCVDATNIPSKTLKDVIFDVFLMKDDFFPILIADHHFCQTISMAYKWGLRTTNWDGPPNSWQGFRQKVNTSEKRAPGCLGYIGVSSNYYNPKVAEGLSSDQYNIYIYIYMGWKMLPSYLRYCFINQLYWSHHKPIRIQLVHVMSGFGFRCVRS